MKIQVPESGDRISAIRVISERREASAEVDLDALEAGDNGTSEVESESVDQVETEEVEASEEE